MTAQTAGRQVKAGTVGQTYTEGISIIQRCKMVLWQKRVIRLWLIIFLPIGVFLSYQTYTSHQTSIEMQGLGDECLYESILPNDTLQKVDIFDYDKEAREYFQLRDKSKRNRNMYAITSFIFICFPLITWMFSKTYRFVMYGRGTNNGTNNGGTP